MVGLIIFIALSAGLIIWSRKMLWDPGTHGFYRFFAFECLLALVIINIKYWFFKPFSVAQAVSWILLVCSIVLAVQGFYLLHTAGRAEKGIENTTVLIKTGVYKYIRHPLYSSLIFLGWGVFLKQISFLSAVLAVLATVFSVAAAMIEEKENLQRFGDVYVSYMSSTRRFIPFLI